MTRSVHAIYENGVFRPTEPVDLPEHTAVDIEVPVESESSQYSTAEHLSRYVGILKSLPIDPLEFQRQMREEWD